MPEKHRQMGDWTPDRFIRWAEKIGPSTAALITAVLNSRRHPQQAYRSCLGLLRLAKCHGDARLEAAATRALAIGSYSYRSVESILYSRQLADGSDYTGFQEAAGRRRRGNSGPGGRPRRASGADGASDVGRDGSVR